MPPAPPSDAPLTLALLLAALIGLSLGLLGGGGSTLAVPVLVYVAGLDARAAVGVSLAVVGATSLVAAVAQARGGRVRTRAAALFAAAGMPAAWAGSRLTALVPGRMLLLAFGGFMVAVALLMLRPPGPGGDAAPRRPARANMVIGTGALVGLLTGFLGVTAVSITGALAGTRLSRRLPAERLRRAFAVLVLLVGAAVVAANLAAPS